MEKELSIIIDQKEYKVHVTKKSQRNMYFRYRDDMFFVTTPRLVSDKKILESLKVYGPRLIKRSKKATELISFKENYVYIFGDRIPLSEIDLTFEELGEYLKDILLRYVKVRVVEIAQEMNVKTNYKVRVRMMKSRHGSNSRKTHTLTFQLSLVHYSKEIIDSVIYHELAHDFYFDHSANFYKLLLSYCPNYFKLKAKLRKGIVQ